VDEKDKRILDYLTSNGRDKIADISRNLDIPRITVYERMQKMISDGIIRGFTVIPDYLQIGLSELAFIFVSFDPKANVEQREMAKRIACFSEVSEVSIITGQWDLLLKVRGKTTEDIGNFVLDKLRLVPGVEKSETISVFSVVR
jgi:DNA-binding Lrp family transcriptional regulator